MSTARILAGVALSALAVGLCALWLPSVVHTAPLASAPFTEEASIGLRGWSPRTEPLQIRFGSEHVWTWPESGTLFEEFERHWTEPVEPSDHDGDAVSVADTGL